MKMLTFRGRTFDCAPGESVLDCLTRQGETIPSGCRSWACESCLMRALKAAPSAAAQAGLRAALREQNYFLACQCRPNEDMEVALPTDDVAPRTRATVVGKERLNPDILRLSLRCQQPFAYHPGQFAHLRRSDGLMRSYSLASLPAERDTVDLHVRRLPDGAMSGWIHDTLQVGDEVELAGPHGSCFYLPDGKDQGLLLIGTGSGLAPLWGIVRDALRQGHRGPIRLYHGSYTPEGLYLVEELRDLSAQHPQFVYTPCVESSPAAGYREGRADQVAFCEHPDLKGWRVTLCGHPEMVKSAKRRAFMSGASIRDIFADPFVLSAQPMAPA